MDFDDEYILANAMDELRKPRPFIRGVCKPENAIKKTRLCRYWMQKTDCLHGDSCEFAHGPNELDHIVSRKQQRVGETWPEGPYRNMSRVYFSTETPLCEFQIVIVDKYMATIYEALWIVTDKEARSVARVLYNDSAKAVARKIPEAPNTAVRDILECHLLQLLDVAFEILRAAA